MRHIPPRIIVVEDEPLINELVCEILTDEGYTASGYLSADEAYPSITKGPPDLVVIGLCLCAGEAGLSLLKQLRRHPLTKDMPAIMCSCATERLTALQNDLRSMHCATLEKPFEIRDLITVVQRALADSFEYIHHPLTSLV
jgi:DNA-binding NtrC family response regulator